MVELGPAAALASAVVAAVAVVVAFVAPPFAVVGARWP